MRKRMISAFLAAIMLTCNLGLESYAMDSLKDAEVIAAESVSENTVSEEENIVESEENVAEETPVKEDTEEAQETTMGVEDKEEEEAEEALGEERIQERAEEEGVNNSAKGQETQMIENRVLIQSLEEENKNTTENTAAPITILGEIKLFQKGDLDVIGSKTEEEIPDYSILGNEERVEYSKEAKEYLYQQLKNSETLINLQKYEIDFQDTYLFFNEVVNENPDLYKVYWINNVVPMQGNSPSGWIVKEIIPLYYEGYNEQQFEIEVENALSVIEPGMTDLEKAIALHDYLVLNCAYDYDNYLNGTIPEASYSAYGILVNKTGVCNGYALAYKLLCQKVGIECLMVTSNGMNHAWNLIKLGQHYYHVDVTWDDPVRDMLGRVRHYYMFSSDNSFVNDKGHYDWEIVKNGSAVDLSASDTAYDNYFWIGIDSLMVYEDHGYYYISSSDSTIKKIQLSTMESTTICNLGLWYVWEDNGWWKGAFSGLFRSEDKLYFNKADGIYSVNLENYQITLEYANPKSSEGYIYGMANQGGVIKYIIGQDPRYTEDFKIYTAELGNKIEVPVTKVVLQDTAQLILGEQLSLEYSIYPSHATAKTIEWKSDNHQVATVTEGKVTAKGVGSCNITITVDGISATCKITVIQDGYKVTFWKGDQCLKEEVVKEGKDATPPQVTADLGYEFSGWDKSYKNIQGELALYAQFTPIKYKINYILGNGVNHSKNPKEYTIETETFNLADASGNSGAVFEGWYKESNFLNKVISIEKGTHENLTLYARWKLESPIFVKKDAYVALGETVELKSLNPQAKIYFTLDGTNPKEGENLYTTAIPIENQVTIRAIAVGEGYITSDITEQTYSPYTSALVLKENKIEIGKEETAAIEIIELPTGKTQKDVQWTSQNSKIVKVENGVITPVAVGTTTVTATTTDYKGKKVSATCSVKVLPALYTVTFMDKEGDVFHRVQVEEGKAAIAPTVGEVVGYSFVKWDKDFTKVTENLEIYPVYEAVRYSVNYYLQENTIATENPAEYTIEDEEILLKEPALPEGINFVGWYANKELTGEKITGIPKASTGDKEFYAAIEYQQYPIEYRLEEGIDNSLNPTLYTIEKGIQLKEPGQKEGFIFVGWYDNKDYEGNPIEWIEDKTGAITLYPKWKDERGLWMEEIGPLAYTGTKVQPENVQVFYGGQELTQGTDYTISYKNNVNANDLSPEMLSKAPTVVIKGKGNYTGSVTENFVIERKSLEDEDIIIDDLALAYKANKKQLPVPKVLWNKKSLVNKKDFKITYLGADKPQAFVEPGEYKIRIEGINNYTGSREITLKIASSEEILLSKVKVVKIPNQIYDGNPVDVEDLLQLTYNKIPLVLNQDYELIYEPCIQAGSYTVVIVGKGVYKGTLRTTFNITGIPMNKVKVSIPASVIYNGENLTPDDERLQDKIVLTYSYKEGKETKVKILTPEDYEISCSKGKDKGTVQVTITGKNSYSGSIKKNVKIVAYEMKNSGITVDPVENIQYEKNGSMPKVTVKFNGEPLKENKDYKLSYKNNQNVNSFTDNKKDALVVITGMGNYSGKREVPFEIEPKNIAEVNIWAADLEEAGAGKYISVPKLTDNNNKALSKGKDYEAVIKYYDEFGHELGKKDVLKAGRIVTVKLTGKGNYQGEASTKYRILEKKMSIAKASVTLPKGKKWYYTGEAITLDKKDITVKIGKETLGMDDFRIISYGNNTNKGTAKVTIEGLGRYGGRKEISFIIQSQPMKWWKNLAAK